MEDIFKYCWQSGLIFAATLYLVKFNDLSETELVRWSYVWLPLIAFGVAGALVYKSGMEQGLENALKLAFISAVKWTVVIMAAIIIFYEVFWDQL